MAVRKYQLHDGKKGAALAIRVTLAPAATKSLKSWRMGQLKSA
jgi:hypothetical protein